MNTRIKNKPEEYRRGNWEEEKNRRHQQMIVQQVLSPFLEIYIKSREDVERRIIGGEFHLGGAC